MSAPTNNDRPPEPVILWDLDETEHREWRRAGCGDIDYEAYRAQLEVRRHAAEKDGKRFVLVQTRVAEVLSVLREIGLVSSPAGCEAALLSIHEGMQRGAKSA